MDARTIIAKLNARTSSFFPSVSGAGYDALRPDDVAYALAKIKDPGAAFLVEVKWAGNARAVWPLILELQKVAGHIAMNKGWRVKPGMLEGMTILALRECEAIRISGFKDTVPQFTSGSENCRKCNGIGAKIWRSKKIECPACDGGRRHWTDERRARAVNSDPRVWVKYLLDKYLDIKAVPIQWEYEALKQVKRSIK